MPFQAREKRCRNTALFCYPEATNSGFLMADGKGYHRQNKAPYIERKRPKSPRKHTAGNGFGRFCVSGANR